jgi:hypothetical protein
MPDSCPGPSGGAASLQERLYRTCTKGCNGCSLIPETGNRAGGRAVDGRPQPQMWPTDRSPTPRYLRRWLISR